MGMTTTGVGNLYGYYATLKGMLVIASYGALNLEIGDSDQQLTEMHNFLPGCTCIYMGYVCTFVIYFQFVGSYEPFLSGSETKENTEVCMSMYFYSQLSSTN